MKTITIGTDFGPTSTLAIKTAIEWGKKLKEKINILHVDDLTSKIYSMSVLYSMELSSPKIHDFNSLVRKSIGDLLRQQLEGLGLNPSDVDVTIREGEKISMILKHLQEIKPSLFFLGNQFHPFLERIFLGSTTEKMAQISPVPLVIVRDERVISPNKFLFAIDFSPLCYKTVEWVKKLSKIFNAKIYLLHILTFEMEESILTDPEGVVSPKVVQVFTQEKKFMAQSKMEKIKANWPLQENKVETEIVVSTQQNIANEIISMAQEKDVDMIFLAKHSKSVISRFLLGSVATKILRYSSKSLFLLNDSGMESQQKL